MRGLKYYLIAVLSFICSINCQGARVPAQSLDSLAKKNPTEYLRLFDSAYKAVKDDQYKVRLSLYRGVAINELDSHKVAKEIFDSIELNHITQLDTYGRFSLKLYLGLSDYYKGEYLSSIENLKEILNHDSINNWCHLKNRVQRFLGEVYRASQAYEEAIEILNLTLITARECNDSLVIAGAMNRLGVVYYELGEHLLAEQNLSKSLLLSKKKNYSEIILLNLNDLGELYFATKNYDASLELYEDALAYNLNASTRINTLNNKARLEWELGRTKLAISDAKAALSLLEHTDIQTLKVDALKILADSYAKAGSADSAISYYQQYILEKDTLAKSEQLKEISRLEKEYETLKKQQLINQLIDDQKVEELKQQILLIIILVILVVVGIFIWLTINLQTANNKIEEKSLLLEQSNQTKNKLFSIISHDLKNASYSIQNLGAMIRHYHKKNDIESLENLANQLDVRTSRFDSLLQDLLKWSLAQLNTIELKKESLLVENEVKEVALLFEEQLRMKSLVIEVDLEKGIEVCADRESLQLVLRNVLGNAVKFSEENSRIRVSNSNDEITVEDFGVGMTEQELSTILRTPGNITKEGTKKEKGSGLGLLLVSEYLHKNGGSIRIESSKNIGTKVFLKFQTNC